MGRFLWSACCDFVSSVRELLDTGMTSFLQEGEGAAGHGLGCAHPHVGSGLRRGSA